MLKVAFSAVMGLVVGICCVAWVIPASLWLQRQTTDPPLLKVDHWVYYVIVALGGAAGAVCGALAAATAVLAQALRDRGPPRP